MQQQKSDVLGMRGSETDDFLKVERLGLEPIPTKERHGGSRELALVWTGAMANYVSLLTGALVISAPLAVGTGQGQLGMLDSVLAITLGSALAAILHGLVSTTGAKTGTPQMIFARAVLGHRGAYLSAAFTWLMAVGWFAVDCIIGGWALVQLAGFLGLPTNGGMALGAITLVLIASIGVAVYGHQTVHVFEKYGAIVFMAFSLLLLFILFPKIHWDLPTTVHGPSRLAAMIVGGSFLYALIASWIPFASDYSRYLPQTTSTRSITRWTGLGIGLPTILLGILGVAFSTIQPNNPDLLSVITQAAPRWLTIPFLLFVVLGEIWANYFDVYTASLVALAMDIPLHRWLSALLCGAIGAIAVYAIAVFSHFSEAKTYSELTSNFLGIYTNFLLLTYLWVPAWATILLIDFFLFRKGRYEAEALTQGKQGRYWYQQGISWQGVIAWLFGIACTLPFIGTAILPWSQQPWQGPLAHLLGGADISGIVGALISAVTYYGLGKAYYKNHKDGF